MLILHNLQSKNWELVALFIPPREHSPPHYLIIFLYYAVSYSTRMNKTPLLFPKSFMIFFRYAYSGIKEPPGRQKTGQAAQNAQIMYLSLQEAAQSIR